MSTIQVIDLILLIFAFVFFVIAALNVPARWNLMAAGLACWVMTLIINLLHAAH